MFARYYTGRLLRFSTRTLSIFAMTRTKITAVILCAFILGGCAQQPATATPTSLPESSLTPSVPLIALLAPPDSDPSLVAVASEVATAYASANNMQFEQRALLNPADLPPSLSKLIVLPPDPGASALAAAAPNAQVIAVGIASEGSPANLTTLALGGNDDAQIAFVAGYIAALSAEDWRAGIMYTGTSASNVNDFVAGVEYFCGSCAPFSPPLSEYPVAAQAADPQNWQSAADQLLAQFVNVVYLTPELEASGAAQYLVNSRVLIIGNGTPPEELSNSWIVSVSANPAEALRQLLPLALNGQPAESVNSLSLAHANANLFSESRQADVQKVIEDLLSGYIQLPAD